MSTTSQVEPSVTPTTESTKVEPVVEKTEVQYATKDEVNTILKRLDGQSAILNQMQKQKSAPAETSTAKPGDPDLVERVKAIELRNQAAAERETRQKDREALQRMQAALIAGGSDPKQAPRFAKLLKIEHSEKIKVDDDFNVAVAEAEGKTHSIEDWVSAYLQTEEGKVFLPPKLNPKSNGLNGSTTSNVAGKRQVTKNDLASGRVEPKDILDGKVEIVD